MPNSRAVALQILARVETGRAYADLLLDAALTNAPALDARDKALTTELVYGVLRWQKRLDWYLDQVCNKPLRTTHPWLRMILRLGAYQLLMLDKIPPSAAINESVKLAETSRSKANLPAKTAKGFVNAVLRNLHRQRTTLQSPDAITSNVTRFAVTYSYPEWMIARWLRQLGEELTRALCQVQNRPPHLTLRINTLKTSLPDFQHRLRQAGQTVTPLPGHLPGVVVSGHPPVAKAPWYRSGHCTVQNASSMLISQILDPQPGDCILDGCAGSGTKTTHLGELMHNHGHILAVDPHQSKLHRLEENCRRLGVTIVHTACQDMTTLPSDQHSFDRILLDVPCSGLGVLRKHPEAKWTIQEAHIPDLQTLQLRLVTHAAILLPPQTGTLVYSTCTTEPEENEAVIRKFLHTAPGFRVVPPFPYLPELLHQYVTEEGFLRIIPQEYFDGFFCARLTRD
ncbi:16S rRNA (cytosine(967)-C(5))-methyltransferase RsmB [candidate division KSB3 bacterium]|uniref:16S rRNA (cytosine(967)-C(5))-methyltransferase n=1 Tax=candidate division KSB3 bacterium TaxID=2044937 RepID=A0A9D5K0X2_9BACT|nr:16S rRNA (cytosine(967)-C(5))-methyltransferase RsmB [candidate division KSB3 bacterium]MBD3327500.1 16S rRNA (cytosine(967)-C(5))-methyltransferase RsmB [candidate division KSB3 bacterium]